MVKRKKPDTWFCISHEFRLAKYVKAYTVEEAAEKFKKVCQALSKADSELYENRVSSPASITKVYGESA